MNYSLYTFAKKNRVVPNNNSDRFGLRGSLLLKLSELELPVSPGFIIDSETFKNLSKINLKKLIGEGISFIEKISYKDFNDGSVPLTVKVVLSPSIDVDNVSMHNVGLNENTINSFSGICGENFAYGEFRYFLKKISENWSDAHADELNKIKDIDHHKDACSRYNSVLPDSFSENSYEQIEYIIRQYHQEYFSNDLNKDIPCALFVQMMVYGNFGTNSYNGEYYTRNIATGKNDVNGFYGAGEMFTNRENGMDISKIDGVYYDEFKRIANIVETHFLDMKYIRFTIERGILWLVSVFNVDGKSTRAEIKLLLDLHKNGVIDDKHIITKIVPNQLNDLLHSTIELTSKKGLETVSGGIAGSPGSCIGKVYFSTKKLLDAYHSSVASGNDSRFILAMEATYAGDVQAIEIGQGVISGEGGFASHAPVVARSLGKPALVNPNIQFSVNSMIVDGVTVKEGDYISMEINHYSNPTIYLGQVKLEPPDMENNQIFDLMKIITKNKGDFYVRANADNKKEASLAKKLGAQGIGLCRTEHMFFGEDRINIFREILLVDDANDITKILNELKQFQIEDFRSIFEAMKGDPVTIRLLDAPLHEFIPQTIDQKDFFNKSYTERNGTLNPIDVKLKFDRLKEINPMLGHRGCRIAISFFDIYEMQIESIFEAAYVCSKNGLDVVPEILIPMVMSDEELKFIIYGKDIDEEKILGILGIEKEFLKKYDLAKLPFQYRIGTMIELPAAALCAADLAKHVSFFSYGTNDLTQTTHGLSRDDINSFLPSYTKFDILEYNPFQILTDQVKTLIEFSSLSGRLVRPNLKIGLCGEHGANEENIKFCINSKLNYVSCSPYGVPIALLSVARNNITH